MASDWEDSEEDVKPTAPLSKAIPAKNSKWAGEDEEQDVASDWDASSDEEAAPPTTTAAPAKKKGTLKAKLAEKEAARLAAGSDEEEDIMAPLHPREQAKLHKEEEMQADLKTAGDLFGAANGTGNAELDQLVGSDPRSKEDFLKYSKQIFDLLIKPHASKPLYAQFVEMHCRELAGPLRDVEVRKVASGLTTLANEKQKEARDKASGKKKTKAGKPALGGAKAATRVDTTAYNEALDDFGKEADDFM